MPENDDLPDVSGYSRMTVAVAAVIGLAVMVVSYLWAKSFDVFHESLYRVSPTVEGGGIGTDWVAGNTRPALDFLIALIHAADVIMGAFILVMVFVHWAAFRRLADRMREPGETAGEAVAADGGQPAEDADSSGGETA